MTKRSRNSVMRVRDWKPDSYPFTVPASDYELSRLFPKDELLEDLRYMVDKFIEIHPNLFFSISRAELSDQIEEFRIGISKPLTRLEFYRRIAPIAASFDDGHTMVSVPHEEFSKSDEAGNIRFPFSVDCSGSRIFLAGTPLKTCRKFLGSELLGINGEPIAAILSEMRSVLTGEKTDFKCSCIPMLFYKLLFILREGSVSYSLVISGGSAPETISVPGVNRRQSRITSLVGPEQHAEPYFFEVIDDHDCAILTLLRCEDIERFREFCSELFTVLDRNSIGTLLIDLRHNGGGTSDIGDELCAYLTEKPFFQFSGMEMKISRKIKKLYADR
ncbi:MAG: hypothetical protein GF388_11510, partial [Candidatus Aegiribacteria sp.]|nr:hypothetical protein [Candidatus Aegiribacteria sp.]